MWRSQNLHLSPRIYLLLTSIFVPKMRAKINKYNDGRLAQITRIEKCIQLYATLPKSTPPSQNIPPPRIYSSIFCYYNRRRSQNLPLPQAPRMYPLPLRYLYATLLKSTHTFQNIPPLFNYYMRPSQNLSKKYSPLFHNYLQRSENLPILLRIHTPFSQL